MLFSRAVFSAAVAVAVFWHAIVGCCAHHAHGADGGVHAVQHFAGLADHTHDEEHPGHPLRQDEGCNENVCASVLSGPLKVPRDATFQIAIPPARPTPQAVLVAAVARDLRRCDLPVTPSSAASRLHCALSVWLL